MKTIVIDPFDPMSVSAAIVQMVSFKNWLRERVDKLCEILAKDYALKTVAEDYGYTEGGEIYCGVRVIPNGWVVTAQGKGVFFVEYGTGTLAGTGEILGTPPVSTESGSFSENDEVGGQHTWSRWEASHNGDMSGYPWTRAPKSGMYFAFRAANDAVQKVAEEVFRS